MTSFLSLLIYPLEATSILLLGIMVITWILSIVQRNAGIVDIAWGISIALVCFLAFLVGDGDFARRLLLLILVALWAARLTSHLYFRYDPSKEDKRYYRLRVQWGDHADIRFLLVFLFQGFLILILTLPFFAISFNVTPALSAYEWIGSIVVLIGILGETIADAQLTAFKVKGENKGKVLETGLWAWSRHPNYFFEWVVWVGLAIFALGSPFGWLGLVSAALMLYLLLSLSGVPMAEKEMLEDRSEAYRRYQQTVSSFFPWPRR